MADVFVLSAVRTAIGDLGGALAGVAPTGLAAAVSREALSRAGVVPQEVDQTVFGHVIHTEPRDMYLSRVGAIEVACPRSRRR